ncbi:MAG: hypothetical protein BWY85_01226 [Firmicutes bacterium ADurb.Bin506]|nr:MAG: hypothetical protein BWY85_01226 [Firmicutes bacterium ADurb.Bin506]
MTNPSGVVAEANSSLTRPGTVASNSLTAPSTFLTAADASLLALPLSRAMELASLQSFNTSPAVRRNRYALLKLVAFSFEAVKISCRWSRMADSSQ